MEIKMTDDLKAAFADAEWWEDHMCGKEAPARDIYTTAMAGEVAMGKLLEIGRLVYLQWRESNA